MQDSLALRPRVLAAGGSGSAAALYGRPAGLDFPGGFAPAPAHYDGGGGGLARSKSVVERLDARFKGAELFDRRATDDDECEWPMDEVLRSLAESKLRKGRPSHLLRELADALALEPRLRVVTVCAGGGAMTLGSLGGSCGLLAGATAGAVAGTVPAFFTLGISIPVGALAGGTIGACAGAVTCTGVGIVGGGLVGGVAYDLCIGDEADSRDFSSDVAEDFSDDDRGDPGELIGGLRTAAGAAGRKALELTRGVREVVVDRKIQVAAASAASGAVACGAGGGAVGWATGGAIGGAFGVIPAILTFGLSIPACATVGSTCGLCAGAALGSAAGLVGGGAAGYSACWLAGDFRAAAGGVWTAASGCAEYLRDRAQASATSTATRCVGGTGGT